MKKGNVLEIKDLSVDFMTVRGIVYAVQGVDLEVKQGEIHGICLLYTSPSPRDCS